VSWLRGLPRAALAVLALVVLIALGAAALYGYRMYDYVQHDNDFCLGCHLMVDPYERFARSEHRGLGCKACHQPTMTVRSKMALTQIIKNPAELETHAEVPNERCEDCHVKGNPEEWRQISSSAGHRVHFESDDKALQGLKCVECHSSSVHEFAATDKTCAQSGCHEGVKIQLGKMGKLTLHCAVCHDFSRPVAREVKGDSLQGVLQPKAEECLSCHAMRQLVAEQFTGDRRDAWGKPRHDGVTHRRHTPQARRGLCGQAQTQHRVSHARAGRFVRIRKGAGRFETYRAKP
jgi:nitrate/TMAO reductase-like tetraheme cytochrome c subunit